MELHGGILEGVSNDAYFGIWDISKSKRYHSGQNKIKGGKYNMITMYEKIKEIRNENILIGYKNYYGKTKKEAIQQILDSANKLIDVRAWVGIDNVDKILGLPHETYKYKDENRDITLSYNKMLYQLSYYAGSGKFKKMTYFYPELNTREIKK